MALSSLGALLKALGDLFADFHGRVMDFLAEADPRTTDELLAEWERVYGLPLCDDAPTGDDERRAALAGRVAAIGGQKPAYYIELVRAVLGDPAAAVTITEQPYGAPFYAWTGSAWDELGWPGMAHYWMVELPSGTSADLAHIVECLLMRYKPAHTILVMRSTTCSGASLASLTISNSPSYDYGSHAVGSFTDHTFTITNVGAGAASDVQNIALPAGFRFKGGSFPGVGGTLGHTLASGDAETVVVEFAPSSAGVAQGLMTFEYCSGSGGRAYVSRQIKGTGT